MPRPKPPAPLRPRNIRLSDAHWLLFQTLGGADWLRKRLNKLRMHGQVVVSLRNRMLRADRKAGATHAQLATKYHVHRTTVWRILGETPSAVHSRIGAKIEP